MTDPASIWGNDLERALDTGLLRSAGRTGETLRFTVPVYLTSRLWTACVANDLEHIERENLWKLLYTCIWTIRAHGHSNTQLSLTYCTDPNTHPPSTFNVGMVMESDNDGSFIVLYARDEYHRV